MNDALVIEFGSRARGESDNYSDNDILCISDAITPNTSLAPENGLIELTTNRLIHSSQNGSLFLKHIFDEGRLISGRNSDFFNLKKSWTAAKTYEFEINENRDLLELLAYIPKTETGIVVAVDITICALRSILIRSLAQNGIYLFSWNELSKASVKSGLIHPESVPLIMTARQIKNAYRRGLKPLVPVEFLLALLRESQPVLGNLFIRNIDKQRTIQALNCCSEKSYKQLRALELISAAYPESREIASWSSWIANPRTFINSSCAY